jgi:hypothetical protein
MSDKYEITIEKIEGAKERYRQTQFKHDDGHFVSTAPSTDKEHLPFFHLQDLLDDFQRKKLKVTLEFLD